MTQVVIRKKDLFPKREFGKVPAEGTGVCKKCHAVFQNKRWFYDEAVYKELSKKKETVLIVCSGCKCVEERKVDGAVILRWENIKSHKDEIVNLIRHEEEKEKAKNPLSRIVRIDIRDGEISLETTTQFLATRIGHAVDKAFCGKLEIQKLPREAFVRVNWMRE